MLYITCQALSRSKIWTMNYSWLKTAFIPLELSSEPEPQKRNLLHAILRARFPPHFSPAWRQSERYIHVIRRGSSPGRRCKESNWFCILEMVEAPSFCCWYVLLTQMLGDAFTEIPVGFRLLNNNFLSIIGDELYFEETCSSNFFKKITKRKRKVGRFAYSYDVMR